MLRIGEEKKKEGKINEKKNLRFLQNYEVGNPSITDYFKTA